MGEVVTGPQMWFELMSLCRHRCTQSDPIAISALTHRVELHTCPHRFGETLGLCSRCCQNGDQTSSVLAFLLEGALSRLSPPVSDSDLLGELCSIVTKGRDLGQGL